MQVHPSDASVHDRFDEYCRRKVAAAEAARIAGFTTVNDLAAVATDRIYSPIASPWTSRLFDGPFYRTAQPRVEQMPLVDLVFVQSSDGNTGARDPATLGGGATDKHLVYEGLSRVDADAVMSGAGTARSRNLVLSLWHPELVALRLARGRPRHPAQIVVTESGNLPFEEGLMFLVEELRAIVITATAAVARVRERLRRSPWVEVMDGGQPLSLAPTLRRLPPLGIDIISTIGGRRTATTLLREHLVSDVYLTTAPVPGGEPNTPYYEGPRIPMTTVVEKAGRAHETGVRFEHLIPQSPPG